MAQQTIANTRQAQRTAGAQVNANFTELYDRQRNVTLDATTANVTFSVPAGYYLEHIVFQNTTANAVTGGVKIGTTNGGTDVVAAQAIAGNALGHVTGADVAKRIFSTTVATTLYLQAVTAWNSASINFRVTLRKMF